MAEKMTPKERREKAINRLWSSAKWACECLDSNHGGILTGTPMHEQLRDAVEAMRPASKKPKARKVK